MAKDIEILKLLSLRPHKLSEIAFHLADIPEVEMAQLIGVKDYSSTIVPMQNLKKYHSRSRVRMHNPQTGKMERMRIMKDEFTKSELWKPHYIETKRKNFGDKRKINSMANSLRQNHLPPLLENGVILRNNKNLYEINTKFFIQKILERTPGPRDCNEIAEKSTSKLKSRVLKSKKINNLIVRIIQRNFDNPNSDTKDIDGIVKSLILTLGIIKKQDINSLISNQETCKNELIEVLKRCSSVFGGFYSQIVNTLDDSLLNSNLDVNNTLLDNYSKYNTIP
jgi:hypothetical protein